MERDQSSQAVDLKDVRIRLAEMEDVQEIERLDALCFPTTDIGAERAAPGEVAVGIASRSVVIAEVPDSARKRTYHIVGFLQYVTLERSREYFVGGIAVHPSVRKAGLGGKLLDYFQSTVIDQLPQRPIVTCTISPSNSASLCLFLSHGFLISRYIPDFYGNGRDRFYLEWGISRTLLPTGHSVLVPVENASYLKSLIDGSEYFVTKLMNMPHGQFFRVEQLGESKEQELRSNESSVSVSFNGILLSSATFILGLTLAFKAFNADTLVYLLSAFLFLTVSLLSYTNAIGEVSRIRAGTFTRYMMFGNIVSEFGGFYPLMHIVPIVVISELHSVSLGLVGCVIAAGALLLYHFYGLSMVGRYVHSSLVRIVIYLYLSLSPTIGWLTFVLLDSVHIWSLMNGAILAVMMTFCLIVGRES